MNVVKTHFGPKQYQIYGRVRRSKKMKIITVYAYDKEAALNIARVAGLIPKHIKRIR